MADLGARADSERLDVLRAGSRRKEICVRAKINVASAQSAGFTQPVDNETTTDENMSLEHTSLLQDIRESIKTNIIVRVDATGCNITDIISQLSVMDGVDADYSREDDGTWDVYGTMDGDEFRLRVIASNK